MVSVVDERLNGCELQAMDDDRPHFVSDSLMAVGD
jgi:hypothetical protein